MRAELLAVRASLILPEPESDPLQRAAGEIAASLGNLFKTFGRQWIR